MKYEKPLIVYSTEAVSAVQNGEKAGGMGDTLSPYEDTLPAYQADE